ncbi:hypothetical protein B0J11DRAFT_581339 [Dendryphion nanum]|uniref:Zn(2)-C6 fungal-type domain-containing protein n=1 Tax=Dendryphion nanum TaxID=256645 RepID=A0A9P9IKK6_9PLEO|nr:hypothetical protein B0J11DRAFT_581339 [Dendryphion nanum]
MARLGSKKSRTGCQQCKRRRVKCDEQRPCTGCVRYGFACSLLGSVRPTPTAPQDIHQDPPLPPPESSAPPSIFNSDSPSTPSGSTYADEVPVRNLETWMADLELMHHWTGYAHLTIPGSSQARQVWGFSVPQEAMRYPFLMHCILAFSAYHLSHINPSCGQRYRLLASMHQAESLAAMNHVLPDINSRNCHAMFASAALLTLNAFVDTEEANVEGLIEIFRLLRGMNMVLESTQTLVHTGPFASILRPIEDPPKPPPLLSSLMAELQNTIAEFQGQEDLEGVASATQHLKDALQHGIDSSMHPALNTTTYWPIKLEQTFLEHLRCRDSPAVTKLLDQYLSVVEFAGTEWWFLSGWRNVAR